MEHIRNALFALCIFLVYFIALACSPKGAVTQNLSATTGSGTKPTVQVTVVGGESYNFALKTNGKLYAWGHNSYGQLGIGRSSGSSTTQETPKRVGIDILKYISAGKEHVIALDGDGHLYAWGHNSYGQLGLGHNNTQYTPQRVRVKEETDASQTWKWKAVAAGVDHTLAIRDDGSLWTWGRNVYGQLGNGDSTTHGDDAAPQGVNTPKQVGNKRNWSIVSGADHSVALDAEGRLYIWGYNNSETLGLGHSEDQKTPEHLQTQAEKNSGKAWKWKAVSAGHNYTVALRDDGTLWSWGSNRNGQLGLGDTEAKNTPQQISSTKKWKFFFAAFSHVLAIKEDNTLWTWGRNNDGQLGLGSTEAQNTPQRLGSDTWGAAQGATFHSVGVKTDGTVWAWGHSGLGRLGLDSTKYPESSYNTPQPVVIP